MVASAAGEVDRRRGTGRRGGDRVRRSIDRAVLRGSSASTGTALRAHLSTAVRRSAYRRPGIGPVPELARAAAGVGHIDVEPDADGIVRGIALRESANGASWPYIVVPLLADIRSGKIAIANGRYRAEANPAIDEAGASSDDSSERNPRGC